MTVREVHQRTRPRRALSLGFKGVLAVCGVTGVAACGASSSQKTIGFAQANLGNGWYEVQDQGVEAAAKQLGYKATVVSASGDPATQNSQVKTFITEHVNGVVLNGTDPRSIAPSISALRSAKIPFVLVNTPLPKSLSSQAYCYVSDIQPHSAAEVGAVMAQKLKAKYGSGASVKTLLVEGAPGDLNAVQRREGWLQGYRSVQGAPKLVLLPPVYGYWTADKALQPVQGAVTANPDLKAVFVETDSMMPAVETALQSAGMWNKVIIGSYDGRANIVNYIRQHPQGPIVATVPNKPYSQGTIAVQLLRKALQGVPKGKACPGGQHVIKGPPITSANAASYYKSMRGRNY